MEKPQQLSPTTLAFMGDGVFSLLVREKLCAFDRPLGELHSRSVKLVNATAQAKAFKMIEPFLTETEISVFKRGRNAHTHHVPKNADLADYHSATGFEAMIGYVYLKGDIKRLREIFELIEKI